MQKSILTLSGIGLLLATLTPTTVAAEAKKKSTPIPPAQITALQACNPSRSQASSAAAPPTNP